MIDRQSNSPDTPRELDDLLAKRAELLKALEEVDQALKHLLPVQQQRRLAMRSLKGSVKWAGDLISPIDEPWDAER